MTYEQRHAALSDARRDAIASSRAWLLASFSGPALVEMAMDRRARLPLGCDPQDGYRVADALARRLMR